MVALPNPRRPRFLADAEPQPVTKVAFPGDSSPETSLPFDAQSKPTGEDFSPSATPSAVSPPLKPAIPEPPLGIPPSIPTERPADLLPSLAPAAPVVVFPEEKLEALFSTIENLRLLSEKLAEQARSDALELAFQIAKRVLESEVRTNPEPLFKLVRSAIQRIGEARVINIRLSPEDASTFESENGAQKVGARLAQINVVADSSLERGDCVLDSDMGMVDGRLQNRLAELRRSVESALEGDAA